jgi:hypothetical protein
MSKLLRFIKEGTDTTLARHWATPIAVSFFSGTLGFILFSNRVLANQIPDLTIIWLASCLGISLFFAIAILRDQSRYAKYLPIGGFILLAAVWWDLRNRSEEATLIRFAHLFVITHLAVAIAPCFKHRLDGVLWNRSKQLFVRFIQSNIVSQIALAGIMLAAFALSKLFDLQWNLSDFFVYLGIFCLFFVQTFFFFAGIEPHWVDEEKTTPFFDFIIVRVFLPLLTVYFAILYAYEIKVLISSNLPKGLTGPLIAAVGSLGTLVILLGAPIFSRSRMRMVPRLYHALLVPLLLLLFYAVYVRVREYGFTEYRYFLFVLGLWLFCISLYRAVRPRTPLFITPLSLLVVSALCYIGPWSAYQVSHKSQLSRIANVINKYDLKFEGPTTTIAFSDNKSLSLGVSYLLARHNGDGLAEILGPKVDELIKEYQKSGPFVHVRNLAPDIMKQLGVKHLSQWDTEDQSHEEFGSYSATLIDDLEGYRYAVNIDSFRGGTTMKELWRFEAYIATYIPATSSIEVQQNGKIISSLSLEDLYIHGKAALPGPLGQRIYTSNGLCALRVGMLRVESNRKDWTLNNLAFFIKARK